jgi:hypothetical protein
MQDLHGLTTFENADSYENLLHNEIFAEIKNRDIKEKGADEFSFYVGNLTLKPNLLQHCGLIPLTRQPNLKERTTKELSSLKKPKKCCHISIRNRNITK